MTNNEKSHTEQTINSIEDFIKLETKPNDLFTVQIEGYPVEFEYINRNAETTIILLESGNQTHHNAEKPSSSQYLVQNVEANCLVVPDPTTRIHDKLHAGWYLGSTLQPSLTNQLSRIFRNITMGKRTIYFGQSAGGFAALLFASMHPDSLAMPVNPQVHLSTEQMPQVKAWLRTAWALEGPIESTYETITNLTTNLISVYAEPLRVRVVYIQNVDDIEHMESHYLPFKKIARPQALAGVALVSAGKGHVSLSTKYLAEALKLVVLASSWGRINMNEIKENPASEESLKTVPTSAAPENTRRDTTRYRNLGINNYNSISDYLSSPLEKGMSTFDYHGQPLDILVRKKAGADSTIVVFHPAATGTNVTRPYFVATSLTDRLNCNAVFLADPSLEWDSSLKISWFAGNQHQPLQQDLPRIIGHIFNQLKTENNIFYGASAGGFAALYYSSLFPGSLAIPINPQTRITAYGKDYVEHYVRTSWRLEPNDDPIELLPDLVIEDLTEHYKRIQPNDVLYVQNSTDWHVNLHMNPFLLKNNTRNRTMKILGQWGQGHIPPGVDYQESLLGRVIDSKGNWFALANILENSKIHSGYAKD